MSLHKILWRQLKRLELDADVPPNAKDWQRFLAHVEQTYKQGDQDRYLLERSLAISSRETQALYDEERRRVQEALRVSEGRYRTLFDNAVDAIFIIDVETRKILDVNQVASNALGYSHEQLLHMTIDDLYSPQEMERTAQLVDQLHKAGNLTFERVHIRKDGSQMPVEVSSIVLEQDGRKVYLSIARDITQRKEAEQELQRLANFDSLTGLANRLMFIDRVSHAIQMATRRNKPILAVLFLDLDGFKAVNDAFGHEQGDALLQMMAQRIRSAVRTSDTVARLGGDEFAILLEGLPNETAVEPIVQKIIEQVSQPFEFHSAQAFITCSVGVSFFPSGGEDPDALVRNADRAMYASKGSGKNSYRLFEAHMKTQALQRLELGNDLRNALEREEMFVLFQPQVNIKTGQLFGLETLARWQHAQRGVLLPDDFIPLAEEMGLIIALSDRILLRACEQVKAHIDAGQNSPRLAVNLSSRDLTDARLRERIENVLERTGFPPALLELELSENTIFRDLDLAADTLASLKKLGVRLAIDDFGTGYSTLSQLARFPFDTLKIDQRFAHNLPSSPAYAAIVNGLVTIAHNLGVELVAEGVETEEQLRLYREAGCYLVQGKLFGMPQSIENLELVNFNAQPDGG